MGSALRGPPGDVAPDLEAARGAHREQEAPVLVHLEGGGERGSDCFESRRRGSGRHPPTQGQEAKKMKVKIKIKKNMNIHLSIEVWKIQTNFNQI